MSKRKPKLVLTDTAHVLAWVERHVKPYDANSGDDLRTWTRPMLERAVLWWHANEQAEGWGDLRQKDVASILLTGLPPLSLESLQEMLDEAHEAEDDSEPAVQQIEANLRRFFVAHLPQKRGALTEQQKAMVFRDFTHWNGGSTPAESSVVEVRRYVRAAMPGDLSPTRVREYLFEQASFDE